MYDGAAQDLLQGIAKLKAVVERRPDDVYHVSNVIVLLLDSDLGLNFHLKTKEYNALKRDLGAIQKIIQAPNETPWFDAEKQAVDLIQKLIG